MKNIVNCKLHQNSEFHSWALQSYRMLDCFHSSPSRHEQHMEESPVPFVIHELWQTGSADSAFGHTAHLQMGLLPWTCPCAGSRGFLKRHRAWEAALAEPCHVNCRCYLYAANWAMFTASLPPSLSDMFTVPVKLFVSGHISMLNCFSSN